MKVKMMSTYKGKPHFWSQLLLSMIAIFALPIVQGVEPQSISRETYPNEQRQTEQQVVLNIIAEQKHLEQPWILLSDSSTNYFFPPFEPHFVDADFFSHAPIRAGPIWA